MQNKLMLLEIITEGHTSLSISVLDITSCIQLEDHYYVLALLNVCKQLPPLKIFKIEWSYQFFPESIIETMTISNWGSLLWAEIFKVFSIVRF